MRLFDSHAHLTDERFASDLAEALDRASEAGVFDIVTIGSDLRDAREAIRVVERFDRPRLHATVGVHPHVADQFDQRTPDGIRRLAEDRAVVAIGETGLDFHYENSPRQCQIESFRAQLQLAEQLGLPIVVHSREADRETASLVREFSGRVSGVLHCFTGSDELLEVGLDADWYVSFSGIITFSSYENAGQILRVPDDRLLVETDSPYLAPVPRRGRRNEPAYVAHVLERLATARDEPPERVADMTYHNACRFYGLES